MSHVIVGAGKYKICRAGLKIQATVDVAVQIPQGSSVKTQAGFLYCNFEEHSFFRKPQSFLSRPLTDWMKPIRSMEDNLL